MIFTLAHLSDLHLGPLPRGDIWKDYFGKRAIGYLSWRLRRRHVHHPEILAEMAKDVQSHRPDHVALTGDLINIALASEYKNAAVWLKGFGKADWVTLVPGNHDTYVNTPWESGLGLWAEYMTGDLRLPRQQLAEQNAARFPFVRQRRNVAIIGASSAVPQSLRRAGGRLGQAQLDSLAAILSDLRSKGFYRILLIHHPPLPGQSESRKALSDTSALKAVLEAEGVELVLHGHHHTHMREVLTTRYGPAHIVGVSSASARAHRDFPAAAWNLYAITRQEGAWLTEVTVRSWDQASSCFTTERQFTLTSG
jgi:3',5'-cyclic AMP phosphodiesterase CpdA